ncbi:MAG: hypothetical protein HC867_01145 [Bacteroidia bacterium]|nr:hypothetical protein [Bacteroidia bacterium]
MPDEDKEDLLFASDLVFFSASQEHEGYTIKQKGSVLCDSACHYLALW